MWRGMLLLFALVLLGADKPRPQQTKQSETQQQIPSPAIASEYAPYPNWRADSCYYTGNHDAADLCAQWRTAHEARRATTWSIVATILSGLAFGTLIWALVQTERSLSETRRANVMNMRENARATRRAVAAAGETAAALAAANKSAEAAAGQVEIARDTAYRQLRAYISFERMEIKRVGTKVLSGATIIKNAGKTPAVIEFYLSLWIGRHPLVTGLPTDGPPEIYRFKFHSPFINAESTETIDWFYPNPLHITDEDAEKEIEKAMADGTRHVLYAYGRIDFTDFQRHRRTLSFAYRNHGALELGKSCRMTPCTWGNTYEDRDKGS